jgi:hypothetical protein
MAQISKLFDSGKASYGSLSRWEKSALVLCFCCITAFIMQVVMPVVKSLVALSLLTGTADKLWSSIYCSPCGNYRGKDFGSNTIAALCWCDEPEKAMAILTVLLKKEHTRSNWGQVSAHLAQIDRKGKISGARWLELCRPFAEHQNQILESQHKEADLSKRQYARYYRVPAVFSLIEGYENHGLLLGCESWYKKLIAKEEELSGKEEYAVRKVMFKLADFYARHNRRADADKVIEQLHAMETHPDSYGDRWLVVPKFTGGYKFECVRAKRSDP